MGHRLDLVNVGGGFPGVYSDAMPAVDVCPFDALEWRPDVDYSAHDRLGLVQDTARLASWRTDG